MFGIAAHPCLFAFSPDLFWLVLAFAFGCGSFWFLWSLMFVSITELIHWFKTCWPYRRHRKLVAMLSRMIALHHRMTQNAAEMMQLIQETLNQADEAHNRRHHDGQGSLRQQYVRGRSLAESSQPRTLDRAGVDEVNPPGPVMLHSVISETPTEPAPHVGIQSLQLRADHRHNPAVNPKSLPMASSRRTPTTLWTRARRVPWCIIMSVSRVSRRPTFPAPSWTRKVRTDVEQSGRDAELHLPSLRIPRNVRRIQRLALQPQLRHLLALACSPLLNPFLNPLQGLLRKYLVPGQKKMTSSFAA